MSKDNIISLAGFQFKDNEEGYKKFLNNSRFNNWMNINSNDYETATHLAEGFVAEYDLKVFNWEGLEEDNPDIPECVFEMAMKYKPENC